LHEHPCPVRARILGDIGVPTFDAPMDFRAWFEAYLGGRWYTFDARHNVPRVDGTLMARGRAAADVAITTTFGVSRLVGFEVVTVEVKPRVLRGLSYPLSFEWLWSC
jgi:transglutaminase-like putative cysteine protease